MKKAIVFIFSMLLISNIFSCGGEGGSGDSGGDGGGASFQEGVTPEDISGSFSVTTEVTNSTCGEEVSGSSMTLIITLSSSNISMTDQYGNDQGSGIVSGNSFKVEVNDSNTYEGCSMTVAGTMIGTVSGDSLSGTVTVSLGVEGSCGELSDCTVSGTMSGDRIDDVEVPEDDDTITIEPESSGLMQPSQKAMTMGARKKQLWFIEIGVE